MLPKSVDITSLTMKLIVLMATLLTGIATVGAGATNSTACRPSFGNLDTAHNPPKLTVFDHSHALFGSQNGQGRARLIAMDGQFGITAGNRHCLLDSIQNDSHFKEWIDRIKGLPNYLIDMACDATLPL